MALKLRKSKPESRETESQARPSPVEQNDWYGRKTPPPRYGSSYDDFLMWASTDGLAPLQEEIDLAVTLWMGLEPVDYGDLPRQEFRGPAM